MSSNWEEGFSFTLGMIAASGVSYIWKHFRNKIPTRWRTVGTLQDIMYYPFLNGDPLQRNRMKSTVLGLQDERKLVGNGVLLVVAPNGVIYSVSSRAHRLSFGITSFQSVLTLTASSACLQALEIEVCSLKPSRTYILNDRLIELIDFGDQSATFLQKSQAFNPGIYDPVIPNGSRIKYYPLQESRKRKPCHTYTELSSIIGNARHLLHEERSTAFVFRSRLPTEETFRQMGRVPPRRLLYTCMSERRAHLLVNDEGMQIPATHAITWVKVGSVVYKVNKDKTTGDVIYMDCIVPGYIQLGDQVQINES